MSNEPTTPQALAGDDWADALAVAPREMFVPDVVWTVRGGLLDRESDPRAWFAAVASGDTPVVTQVDDGNVELTAENVVRHVHRISSSCSAPSQVFGFLRLLAPFPGDRVLEIGTGTGWTAALLSAKLGAHNVTSIEVDEDVAAHARKNLDQAGLSPTLIVGDGAQGHPATAPFDRVHITCAVRHIPYAWVEQTRPGGIIVLPWTPHRAGGYQVSLTVTHGQAFGRLHGAAAYTPLREQRLDYPRIDTERHAFRPRIDPRRIARAGPGLDVALTGLLPGVVVGGIGPDTDRISLWDPTTGSYALAIDNGDEAEAVGPRHLWTELETAYIAWVKHGEPDLHRLGLHIDSTGQHTWLDTPHHRLTQEPNHG